MSAADLLAGLERQGVAVARLCTDSRAVEPGDVFLALKGYRGDGRDFIGQAVARGAAAIVYEAGEVAPIPVPHVAAEKLDRLAGELAHLVYGRPSERLWLAGVTGTNGKTSISQWIAQAMCGLGRKCGVIGTLGSGFPGELTPAINTTPDAVSLHRLLAQFLLQGAAACAMEVSSIGLDQGRVNGAQFDVAIFTNLTRDHLDYHGDIDAYGEAKERLFSLPGLEAAVVNLDDPFGERLAEQLSGRVRTIGYTLAGRRGAAEVLAAEHLEMTATGMAFKVDGVTVEAPLVGRFNASNLLAVIGALLVAGAPFGDIAGILRGIAPPAGRMQTVGGVGQPLVVIDYAHTPDALEQALRALHGTARSRGGRLICVFGCGGDRDTGKRPLMGEVAESLADLVVLTNDNPRGEDPLAILAAIHAGMKEHPVVEPDRAKAIRNAVKAAAPGDVILLAGKGHEPYQEIAGVRHPFSDLAVAQAVLGEDS